MMWSELPHFDQIASKPQAKRYKSCQKVFSKFAKIYRPYIRVFMIFFSLHSCEKSLPELFALSSITFLLFFDPSSIQLIFLIPWVEDGIGAGAGTAAFLANLGCLATLRFPQ